MDNARMQQIKKLLESEPDDSFLWYALAIENVGLGRDDEAIAILNTISLKDPDYVPTYYHLAQALLRKGEKKEALSIMEKGISVAKRKQDRHALSELQSAYNELIYE